MDSKQNPSGVAMPRVIENPTLAQARQESFDAAWVASFLVVGAAIGFGRQAYCHAKKRRASRSEAT
jgi:hypothetical protein